jgi:hypothetical protein
MAICKLFNDESNQIKVMLQQKILENLNFAEAMGKKIEGSAEFDAKKAFMS